MHSKTPALGLPYFFFIWNPPTKLTNGYFSLSFESSQLVIKEKIDSLQNPDEYIKCFDVVKRKIRGTTLYHFAVYLGNKQVVHISSYNSIVDQLKEYQKKLDDKATPRKQNETDE